MKKKLYTAYFLFFISMFMLVVPVVPHHHHANGLICMKNDITKDCCGNRENPNNDHCCSDRGCVTTYFVQQTPSSDNVVHPDAPWAVILFFEPLSRLLLLPDDDVNRQDCLYSESLHGMFLTRATGLRAPPCVFA